MSIRSDELLTRIGVFYDGNYFFHVSNFYNWSHERKSRLNITGLHQFIRNQVAHEEDTSERMCRIVDAHYFRGRLNVSEIVNKEYLLYNDRVMEDLLMTEGVIMHFLQVKTSFHGARQEKGIDVSLALEAFELTFYKKYDVLVLVACDGDYVPLIRKLNALGTRVMVLSWDFEYTNSEGQKMTTRTSQDLLEEVTYPVAMHEIIENRVKKNDPLINNLFVSKTYDRFDKKGEINKPNSIKTSTVYILKDGYGFIKYPNNNLFFHCTNLVDTDFNDLREGDEVEFMIVKNERGENVAKNVRPIGSTV